MVRSPGRKETLRGLSYGQQQVADAAITVIVCGALDSHRRIRSAIQPLRDDGHLDDAELDEWVLDAETSFEDNPTKQRDEAIRSGSLAAMTLMIAAQAMGLVSAPLGGFDVGAVSSQFGIRASEIPVMLVAIGRDRSRSAGQLASKAPAPFRRDPGCRLVPASLDRLPISDIESASPSLES